MNKKGTAYTLIYGLVFLAALGILYTIFLYVFVGQLQPTIESTVNLTIPDDALKQQVIDGVDKYITYFKIMPYVLFIVVIIYMIASSIYKGAGGEYR